jgi:hypothetical protein
MICKIFIHAALDANISRKFWLTAATRLQETTDVAMMLLIEKSDISAQKCEGAWSNVCNQWSRLKLRILKIM